MEDGIDLVFAEDTFEEVAGADIAADYFDPFEQPGANQLALGNPVAYQADDVRAVLDQLTNAVPSSPVAPVTKVGRSRQKPWVTARLSRGPGRWPTTC